MQSWWWWRRRLTSNVFKTLRNTNECATIWKMMMIGIVSRMSFFSSAIEYIQMHLIRSSNWTCSLAWCRSLCLYMAIRSTACARSFNLWLSLMKIRFLLSVGWLQIVWDCYSYSTRFSLHHTAECNLKISKNVISSFSFLHVWFDAIVLDIPHRLRLAFEK